MLSTIKNFLKSSIRGNNLEGARVEASGGMTQKQAENFIASLPRCRVCELPIAPNGGLVKYHAYCRKYRHNSRGFEQEELIKTFAP